MIKRKMIPALLGIIILGIGVFIGTFFPSPSSAPLILNTPPAPVVNVAPPTHPLINPAVTSNVNKHFIINFLPLKDQLIEIQKSYPQKTYLYFNYLNNASSIGLNEKDLFTAASTVKVPLAMALYRAVEQKKLAMTDKYSLEDLDLDQKFGDLYKVGADKQFSIVELIKIMLEQSDNTAMRAILSVFKKIGIEDPLADVYDSMGWQTSNTDLIIEMGGTPNYQDINVKTLTNMFLSLYNATYVSVEHSEEILNFLGNTPFNDKIDAGVPDVIPVSHKIGISEDTKTFSDCGIIYAPNRHYILCVGISNSDEKTAATFMASASKAAYDFVINN